MSLVRFEVCSPHESISNKSPASITRQADLVIEKAREIITDGDDTRQRSQKMKELIAEVENLQVALIVLKNDYDHNINWEEFEDTQLLVNEALIALETTLCNIDFLQNACYEEVDIFKMALIAAQATTRQALDELEDFVNKVSTDYITACSELNMIGVHDYEALMNGIKTYMKTMQAPSAMVIDIPTPACSSSDMVKTAAISSVGTFLLSMVLIHLVPRYARKMQCTASNMFGMFYRNHSEKADPAERVGLTGVTTSHVELSASQGHRL